MTKEELLKEIQARYPDAIPNHQSKKRDFCGRPAFCYIPQRDLYIDVLNKSPHFWQEDYDFDLHPEGDEIITQTDDVFNDLMCARMHHQSIKTEKHQKIANELQKKIDFWDDMCVLQRSCAENKLNYVAFWDADLLDAELWLQLDCPDGKDWEREFSWISERDILDYPLVKLTGSPANLSQIVKHFQFFEFFWRELALWYNNDSYKRHGRLQGFLYANRMKYIKKRPEELTTPEILRGLTISGVLRGYTTFDAKLMYEAMEKYDIKSVYDPCAGWGERMLACVTKDIYYTGVDINEGLTLGYDNMMTYYRIGKDKARLLIGDSALYEPEHHHDAVITCPPYFNVEEYSGVGADSLENYDDFLCWWNDVVAQSLKATPKYFCFQMNNKYRDDMLKIVEDNGYHLIDELYFKSNKSSHFNRKKNGVNLKTEKESMMVCMKDE